MTSYYDLKHIESMTKGIDAASNITGMHSNPTLTVRDNVERLAPLHQIETQVDLAERSGVNQTTIQKLLKSEPPPSLRMSTVDGLATALRVAPWQLLMPNLPAGSPSVAALRGGLDRESMALCAVFQALPEVARRELLNFAAYLGAQSAPTASASISELKELAVSP